MEATLQGLPIVCVYLDYVLVSGKTQEEHLSNLNEVLTRLESAGLRLKEKKCTFCKPEVTYLGHIISRDVLIIGSVTISADDMLFFTISVISTACTGSRYKYRL